MLLIERTSNKKAIFFFNVLHFEGVSKNCVERCDFPTGAMRNELRSTFSRFSLQIQAKETVQLSRYFTNVRFHVYDAIGNGRMNLCETMMFEIILACAAGKILRRVARVEHLLYRTHALHIAISCGGACQS